MELPLLDMELTSLKLETHGEDHGENKDILEWQELETELECVEFYLIHHTLLPTERL